MPQPAHPPDAAPPPAPWQPRFSLKLLLMMILLASVVAAGGRHMLATFRPGANRATFVIFTLVAPLVLLVVVSLAASLVRRLNRH